MTSPDLPSLEDLSLFDVTPDELVDRGLAAVPSRMPDWTPEAGDLGRVFLEALAICGSEIVYALNRVAPTVRDQLFTDLGVTRSDGVTPTATVTVTATTGDPIVVPDGAIFRLTVPGHDPVDFAADIAVSGPGPTLTFAVTGLVPTAAANGIASGTPVAVITTLPTIDSAALASAVTAGADPEDDDSWRLRSIARLQRLTTTLVSAPQFAMEARETPGVVRAFAIDDNNNGTPSAGYVTVAVAGVNGASLSSGAKTDLQTTLNAQAQGNLSVVVIDPTITTVAVTYNVKGLAGYDTATIEANVLAALDAYLSPDTWPWAATVRRNKLIQVIEEAAGVDYLVSLTLPAADVSLSGVAPLADLGTVTPTVS